MVKKLNANHLKLAAIVAMTIDHAADLIFPGFPGHPLAFLMHLIGRITAPIMWFFICEGFHFTRNRVRYFGRMLIFALLSHFAYCFAFGISPIPFSSGVFNQTSVIWPLFLAIVALWLLNTASLPQWGKWVGLIAINLITFPADWSCIAVMAIISMYSHRGNLKKQMLWMVFWVFIYAVVSFVWVSKTYAIAQVGVIFVYPILQQYNGQRGDAKWMKWFFYFYYPSHLIIVGLIRLALYGETPILF